MVNLLAVLRLTTLSLLIAHRDGVDRMTVFLQVIDSFQEQGLAMGTAADQV